MLVPFLMILIIYSTPLMRWEDGSKVILETKWYGIGSKKTTCIIEDSGHFDEQVKGTVYFKRAI